MAQALSLLTPFSEGFRHLCMFRCQEALHAFNRLPPQQARTAWVLCQVGRAHAERMDYAQAAQSFEAARVQDRMHLEGMEVYSTVLWHAKKERELSFLAQEMLAIDRHAPQTWCVLGNFFSLQKEHEAANELFQRALQLNPGFVYAYTLTGHEFMANEDFDKAGVCYRNALRLDPRHYNAMYGLGQILFRQEKYDQAVAHFRAAAQVNPRSSVLHCFWGMALHKSGCPDKALGKFKDAIALDPRNPLARFELASVLASMDWCEEALAELMQLQQIVPGEGSVLFQMGKLHKQLGDLKQAQQRLEQALSLTTSTQESTMIKQAIERLGVADDEQEEEL